MALKSARILFFKSSHNVCNSISRAPKFAPMETIRERRDELGLGQKELANLCGCHLSHISHIEHGRAKPSLEVFVKMTEGLKVSPKRLLGMLNLRSGKSAVASASVIDIQKERTRRNR